MNKEKPEHSEKTCDKRSLKVIIFKVYRQKIKLSQSLGLGRSLAEGRGHPAILLMQSVVYNVGTETLVSTIKIRKQRNKELETNTELFKVNEL